MRDKVVSVSERVQREPKDRVMTQDSEVQQENSTSSFLENSYRSDIHLSRDYLIYRFFIFYPDIIYFTVFLFSIQRLFNLQIFYFYPEII